MLGDGWQALCWLKVLCLGDVILSSGLTFTAPLLIFSQTQLLLWPQAQRIWNHNWYTHSPCLGRRIPVLPQPLVPPLNRPFLWHLFLSVRGQRLSSKSKCTDALICIFTKPFYDHTKSPNYTMFWKWITNKANVKILFVSRIKWRTLYNMHVRHGHLRFHLFLL